MFGGILANDGGVTIGLTQSDQPAEIALRHTSTIWKAQKGSLTAGTAATQWIADVVETYDLSDIPGGGEFVVPSPLYGAIEGNLQAAPLSLTMRIYFTVVELKPEQYIELLEARHFFG
ncbi:hypothetical protein ES705_42255 [subsurface metagenome]